MDTMRIKDFEVLPFTYNDDGINKMKHKEGDMYRMRDNGIIPEPGMVVTVYRVIRVTATGDESMMATFKLE